VNHQPEDLERAWLLALLQVKADTTPAGLASSVASNLALTALARQHLEVGVEGLAPTGELVRIRLDRDRWTIERRPALTTAAPSPGLVGRALRWVLGWWPDRRPSEPPASTPARGLTRVGP
jgi:hypothetical protein